MDTYSTAAVASQPPAYQQPRESTGDALYQAYSSKSPFWARALHGHFAVSSNTPASSTCAPRHQQCIFIRLLDDAARPGYARHGIIKAAARD